MEKLTYEEINNYIIYSDEINSFLPYLTHNDTLDKELKQIYNLVKKVITNCHKVIVSDAHIYNNFMMFIKKKEK